MLQRIGLATALGVGLAVGLDAAAVELRPGDLVIFKGFTPSQLAQVDPRSGAITPIATPSFPVSDLTIGQNNEIYLLGQGEIVRLDARTGETSPVSSGGWLEQAGRISREPSGTLVVLATEFPADPENPPPGFHWSRIVRVDPASGGQTLVSEGGYLDRAFPPPAFGCRDLDVQQNGLIAVSRGYIDPVFFFVDPQTGAQQSSIVPLDYGLTGDHVAVDLFGRFVFGADQTNCWCSRALDLATGEVVTGSPLSFNPPFGHGAFGGVTVGIDSTAYAAGSLYSDLVGVSQYPLRRWNPFTNAGGTLTLLDSYAWNIEVVPARSASSEPGDIITSDPIAERLVRARTQDGSTAIAAEGYPLIGGIDLTPDAEGKIIVCNGSQTDEAADVVEFDPATGAVRPLVDLPGLQAGPCLLTPHRRLLVIDGQTSTIVRFDLPDTTPHFVAAPTDGYFNGLAATPSGTVLVTQQGEHDTLFRLDPFTGALDQVTQDGSLARVGRVAALSNRWAVVGGSGGGLIRVDLENETQQGIPSGGFVTRVDGLATADDGSLLVADSATRRVVRVDPWSGAAKILAHDGELVLPIGIAQVPIDSDGDGVFNRVDNCRNAANSDQADQDDDGWGDVCDNCPARANPGQEDRGTVGIAEPDGVGDACQCGDVNGSGSVSVADAALIMRSLLTPPTAAMPKPELCDVGGSVGCTISDAAIVLRSLLIPARSTIGRNCVSGQR